MEWTKLQQSIREGKLKRQISSCENYLYLGLIGKSGKWYGTRGDEVFLCTCRFGLRHVDEGFGVGEDPRSLDCVQ